MKQIVTWTLFTVTSWLVNPVWPVSSRADDSIADLSSSANAAIRAGDFATGIRLLEQAISLDESPGLSYNLAIARYRQGDVDIARDLFTEVAGAGDPELAAKARYNLGNADYAEAIKKLDQDQASARDQLESAIQNYRAALRINPADADARANIELANRLIDQLSEDPKQDKSEQDKSEQDKSEQDKSEQDQSKQDQSKEDQSKEGQSKEDQSKQDPSNQTESGQQKSSDQASENNQDPEQKTEPDQEQKSSNKASDSDPKPDSKESDSSNQKPDSASGEDSESQNAANEKNGTAPPEGQLSPLEKQSPQSKDPVTPSGEVLRDDQTMTQQEAQKMLQAVRDRELRRRLLQLQQSQSRRVRVDKDW